MVELWSTVRLGSRAGTTTVFRWMGQTTISRWPIRWTLNFGTSDFTIALWLKRQATGVEHNIFSKTASGSWTSGGKEFFISGSDNTVAFGGYGGR